VSSYAWRIKEADGAWVTTTEGVSLIDLTNSKGSVLLGHRDPDVVDRVCALVRAGLSGWRVEDLIEKVTARILARVPEYDQVAFFKTGTAAVKGAVHGFRRTTGKPLVVSAGYHGWDPLWQSPTAPFTLNEHGVFDCYYVADELESFLQRQAGQTACAILAPDFVNLPADTLIRLFSICRDHGVPVVADEVKFGLRLGPGPSIYNLGLHADAVVFSKGMANGFPLACVAGRGEVLDEVRHCISTLTFEAVALAASDATLEKLARVTAEAGIAREGGRFLSGASGIFAASRLPIRMQGTGAIFQFVCGDSALEESFYQACAAAGLLLYEKDNQTPSWQFKEAVVESALERLAKAVDQLTGELPHLVGAAIPAEAWWAAAWNQMDGFCDPDADPQARRAFLTEQLAAG
jgi:glutamate-1-semialdehyde aminotransferase